ncbi:MAG: TlpA disulfide reductase family protein, partial [Bacteroidia bacterium]
MRTVLFTAVFIALFNFNASSQHADAKPLPAAELKTVDGKKVNSSTFTNDGKPIVISFWATWCKPCKKELDAIAENYEDWQKTTGVKLIAISIDDSRSSGKVSTDAKSHAWDYEVYLDENQDFKRAM